MDTLADRLAYAPRELGFGTSGRRGEVKHLTHLEIYINVLAELEYLQSVDPAQGGIRAGEEFYFGSDLRPSSHELLQAALRAAADAGMRAVNLGRIPTPALANLAWSRGRAGIMVTGSHIPFDRNGYKLNTSRGELLKSHEEPINKRVAEVRARLYGQEFAASHFDAHGRFKQAQPDPSAADPAGEQAYFERYAKFFAGAPLAGQRLLVYQHSAVGRDLLVDMLRHFGADVVPMGRSEEFVPIDTENIDAAQLALIQELADEAGPIDAVVSTDGDTDRPLVLGVEGGKVRFFGGDLLGMLVAEFLQADAVVVPISCNDGIDRGKLAAVTEPKTRIGSPFVIAGMEAARAKGRHRVCGWEANGGFLTGSDVARGEAALPALPTRDAFLPILSVLVAAQEQGKTLVELFAELPRRYSRAALLKNFPRPVSVRMVEQFSAGDAARFFTESAGFGPVTKMDRTDGVRILFANGDVAHFRPSGNADELRIYAVADTQQRADEIARMGVAEPDGILRRIERAVGRDESAQAV
jgi:phosphomannomutase